MKLTKAQHECLQIMANNRDGSGYMRAGRSYKPTQKLVELGLATRAPDRGAVKIGRHSIIGSGSVILPGVDIPEGVSVGALSLVRKSLEPWGVYAGAPVRRIKDRDRQLLQDEAAVLEGDRPKEPST